MGKRKWIPVGLDLQPLLPAEAERWSIKTREQAVAYLLSTLSGAERTRIRNMPQEDLIKFHRGWAMGIRKELGLWGQNMHLLQDLSPTAPIHADDASMILIKAVWDRLQEYHDGRGEPGADRGGS
jgi:hypothetical protein